MTTTCRRDCEYYSTYTDTCDYTLIMYSSRGCPTGACTRYRRRSAKRTWNSYRPEAATARKVESMPVPDPPGEEPYLERYIIADCGHEVYDGESLYECEDTKTMCPECVEDKFNELPTAEKAALMGCESSVVRFSKRGL